MSTETSMIPGAIALVIGSVSALLVTSRIARKASDSDTDTDTPVLDLEEEVGHAVLMLRDLEHHKNRIDPASYQAQKEKLEKEAAQALRQRDAQVKAIQEKKEVKTMSQDQESGGFLHNRPQLKGFLWGALVMSVGFGL